MGVGRWSSLREQAKARARRFESLHTGARRVPNYANKEKSTVEESEEINGINVD